MYDSYNQEITALKKALLTVFVLALLVGVFCQLTGCNTVAGLGQDIGDTADFFMERHNTGWDYDQ